MSRVLLVAIITLFIFTPLVQSVEVQSRNSILEIESSTKVIINPGETVEASITVRNLANSPLTIYFDSWLPNNISITGLPNDYSFETGQIRQFKFYFTCQLNTNFSTTSAYVNLTTDYDTQFKNITQFEIMISPESDLRYGVTKDSEFNVDPGIRINLAVNMTNFATYSDNVTFSLDTQSTWAWGWSMNISTEDQAFERFQPSELKYISMWIEVPPVIDSSPLFMTGPRFTLVATSGLDYETTTWSFELLMSEFRNITVDSVGDNLSLDPDSKNRIPITIKNVGNVDNYVDLQLAVIDKAGTLIQNIQPAAGITYDDWNIAIFGGDEDGIFGTQQARVLVNTGQTRTFEVAFQSPNQNQGNISIRVLINPNGAVDKATYVDLYSEIIWTRSLEVDLLSENCNQLLPSSSCSANLRIYNNGNYQDNYQLEIVEQPDFATVSLPSNSFYISKNSYIDVTDIAVTANDYVLAFTNSQVVIDISISDNSEIKQRVSFDVIIAPTIEWTVDNLVEETDAIGRFNIAMTLRNNGNAVDGIIVQLQCSHFTPMSLIPPIGAVVEEGIENPRSFEIDNVSLGNNFTIRGWAEIPAEQTSNGTMYLNVTIRSRFAPDEPIQYSTSVQYLGVQWQPDLVNDDGKSLSEVFEDGIQILSSWFWIIISLLASLLIVNKALKDRKYRVEKQQLFDLANRENKLETQDDWLTKFEQSKKEPEKIISKEVSAKKFEQTFKMRTGTVKTSIEPVNEELRDAASLVLDTHDKTAVITEANKLLSTLSKEGMSLPNQNNDKLLPDEYITDRTQRSDPQRLIKKPSTPNDYVRSIPLPDDELDF